MGTLLIIFGFSTLVTFIIFGFITALKFIEYKQKLLNVEQKVDSSKDVKTQEEISSLKHRVMILEKIVTDKGYQLQDEIEKLKSVK